MNEEKPFTQNELNIFNVAKQVYESLNEQEKEKFEIALEKFMDKILHPSDNELMNWNATLEKITTLGTVQQRIQMGHLAYDAQKANRFQMATLIVNEYFDMSLIPLIPTERMRILLGTALAQVYISAMNSSAAERSRMGLVNWHFVVTFDPNHLEKYAGQLKSDT